MVTKSVHSLLRKHGLRPKKRLGQHFLAAAPTAKKIVDSLNIGADDIVMEIGSGPGIITGLIAQRAANVLAVDKDKALIEIAKSELAEHENIEWINKDILKLNLDDELDVDVNRKIKIIGNLPYNISTPILFWMIENRSRISEAVIMLQKEVALRITAGPGCKDYGILSVLSQTVAGCKKLFDVSAKSFIPPPNVTSTVIKLDFESTDYEIEDEAWFKKVVKAAFGKRRKTLRNALRNAKELKANTETIDDALESSRIDGKRRPETLSIDNFIALAANLR